MVILYSKSPSSNSQNIISHSFNKSSHDIIISLISRVLINWLDISTSDVSIRIPVG